MAIHVNTPRGEGYIACIEGKPRHSNPYNHIEHSIKWDEWDDGWYKACITWVSSRVDK